MMIGDEKNRIKNILKINFTFSLLVDKLFYNFPLTISKPPFFGLQISKFCRPNDKLMTIFMPFQ